ncbi:MAG: PQQ-dependent sugar dehydrogenase [Thermomicrobiales bacterium]
MVVRTLLMAGLISIMIVACVVGDDDEPATPTPVPTAPIVGTRSPSATSKSEAPTPTAAQDLTATPSETPQQSSDATETSPPPSPDVPTVTVTPLPPPPATATATVPSEPVPLDQLTVGLELVVDGLDQPDGIANAGDDSGRLFILEQPGRIRVVLDGELLDRPFLDITGQVGTDGTERGLLGLAFHPEFPNNGRFFVNYTNNDGNTVISEFGLTNDPNVADPASEKMILFVEQPASNHNGGHLAFGPDGYLWIGLGDGGAAGDAFNNAQNSGTLLGAMLRIDIDGADPYGVPADNPFIDDPDARNELWAIGLRNPWRYSFDRQTGDLYIADVGQGQWEEISFQPAGSTGGENYGWPIIEGSHCYESDSCTVEGLVRPIAEYDHAGGNCAVTGGYVYRGELSPALTGTYVYADYCSGRFWGLRRGDDGIETQLFFQRNGALFSSFGEDEQGEIYVASLESGAIYRVVAF